MKPVGQYRRTGFSVCYVVAYISKDLCDKSTSDIVGLGIAALSERGVMP